MGRNQEEREEREGYVKRVVLPSGKTIDVVYFDRGGELAAEPAPTPAPVEKGRTLHVCPDCTSGLVYPTQWEESGPGHWNVALRCPNCEWDDTGVFAQDDVDGFDEELDRGTELLMQDLKRLTQANMAEEIERFAGAIHAGAILPEDF